MIDVKTLRNAELKEDIPVKFYDADIVKKDEMHNFVYKSYDVNKHLGDFVNWFYRNFKNYDFWSNSYIKHPDKEVEALRERKREISRLGFNSLKPSIEKFTRMEFKRNK